MAETARFAESNLRGSVVLFITAQLDSPHRRRTAATCDLGFWFRGQKLMHLKLRFSTTNAFKQKNKNYLISAPHLAAQFSHRRELDYFAWVFMSKNEYRLTIFLRGCTAICSKSPHRCGDRPRRRQIGYQRQSFLHVSILKEERDD